MSGKPYIEAEPSDFALAQSDNPERVRAFHADGTILGDARRIMALADEMRAEADRIQREADAFWQRCRERAAESARKRLAAAEVV